jgi:hypothetical protein
MTTESEAGRFPRDPHLQRLHDELTSSTGDDQAVLEGADELEPDPALAALSSAHLSPTVQQYITELLRGGENPTPAARQRFVQAAARGLAHRRSQHGPLPTLLAVRRLDARRATGEIADALGMSEDQVLRVEAGKKDLRDLEPSLIATWIRTVNVEPEVALAALRTALERTTRATLQSAAGRPRPRQLTDEDQRFIEGVAEHLRQ